MDEQQPSYPIGLRNNLLTAEHRRKLGNRIWELAWLVDRVTEEYVTDGGEVRGKVLGGIPIQAGQIADHYGLSKDSVLDSLDRLELAGYIIRVRTGRGYLIEVRNSCKWPHRLAGPNTSPPSSTGPPTNDRSESRRVGGITNSPTQSEGYPSSEGAYPQNPQLQGPESPPPRVGESEEGPTLRTSDSPTPKDVAMEQDIASGNDSIHVHDGNAPALDPATIWRITTGIAGRSRPVRYQEALSACRPLMIDDDRLVVAKPTDPQQRQVVEEMAAVLLSSLRVDKSHPRWLTLMDPNEARGP